MKLGVTKKSKIKHMYIKLKKQIALFSVDSENSRKLLLL